MENLFFTHLSTIATIATVWLGRVGSKASVLGFFGGFFLPARVVEKRLLSHIGTQISDSSRHFKASELWEGEHYPPVFASSTSHKLNRNNVYRPDHCFKKC